ncbi:SusC/RagA family TonB-linked outer membrane protein [Flavobacterium pallidum]|uniref:SusC/RagA family TonB-linked outer membrane protein n=1 Tax=Flavobacterium pallidum TaxID=2172098 RepID=A0A2S1SK06_9FLAO|nr:TonB-dependent receptor [Flavobacterium pallidum]AWI26738.1 SusC/RagA family TonB-linked outer membrane protein [Flavobacterium pallidum]
MRNSIFSLMAFVSLLCLPSWASAQNISGKVLDEMGMPMPGVSVTLVSSTTGTITDMDGNFSVAANPGDQLQFSFMGYQSQTVVASAGMTVSLKPATTDLSEVVVIGYGTASKRDLTGSIVKVKGSDVADKPNTNPVASLQGKVAGLQITNAGQPGQEPDIRIRGTVSKFKTKPLYVIDGIWNDNMSFVNPNDIDSIEVLKDPSSLAVFGVRGANGVIIISTKKAKEGKTVVNFNTSTGVKDIKDAPSMTNGDQFRTLYNQQRANQGLTPYDYALYMGDTNWVDEISANNPMITMYNISVSNGTDKNRIYVGAGYTQEDGLIKNEEFKKFTFSINDELKVSDRFKVGVGMNGYDARLPQLHDFNSALNATPIVTPFNVAEGVYNQLPSEIGGPQIGNPLASVDVVNNGTQINRDTRFVGNAFAEFKLIDNLKIRGNYLADLGFSRGRGYTPVFDVFDADSNQLTPYSGNTVTKVNQFKSDAQYVQQELLLTYDKSFGKHEFASVFGYTRSETRYSSMDGTVLADVKNGFQIPNDPRFWYINVSPFGDIASRVSNSSEDSRSTVSYLARVLYNYDGKYLLNATYRNDASSELTKKFNAWSVGAAWEISKESFMDNSAFNYLKIKGSAGQLGNQVSSIPYPAYPGFVAGTAGAAVFGDDPAIGLTSAFIPNDELNWEVVTSYEFGFELATLKNRLSLEANYYDKKTSDLLDFVFFGGNQASRKYVNAGEISNKGIELMGTWKDKVGDFEYSVSGNITTFENEVISTYDSGSIFQNGSSIVKAGAPIGAFYGYEVEGVYQSYADILASPPSALGSYDVGDLKFKDRNNDGVIDGDDRGIIGNPTPDFTYGFSFNLNYKNFSFSADFQGVYGNEIWRDWGNGSTFAPFNFRSDRLNAWNGPGTSNWEPRLNTATGYNVNNNSSYMIEDGSYMRLRNIQLGYSFDTKFLESISIQNLRLYLNAQNPFTWANNSGFSPEAPGSPTRFGVDTGGYPVPAIYSLGLSVTF